MPSSLQERSIEDLLTEIGRFPSFPETGQCTYVTVGGGFIGMMAGGRIQVVRTPESPRDCYEYAYLNIFMKLGLVSPGQADKYLKQKEKSRWRSSRNDEIEDMIAIALKYGYKVLKE